MKRQVVESAGLEWFAEIGIIIFVAVFALVFIRLVFMNKDAAEAMGRIPLDDESPSENEVAA